MLKLLRRKNKKRGFTLVEAVISTIILGFYLGTMVIVLIMWRKSATMAKDHIAAINLCQEKMEELKNKGYTYLNDNKGTEAVTSTYPYLASTVVPGTETRIIDYGRDLDGDGDFDDGEGDNEGESEDELTGDRITQIQPINDAYGEEMYLKVTVTVRWTVQLLGITDQPTTGGHDLPTTESLVTYISQ